MIKLYYYPSANPAKVALFLEEAGLEYEVVPVDNKKGVQLEPWFLEINPNGKTPALTDGSATIFDSTAILLYLAQKTGKFLCEDSNEAHGRMLSWLLFLGTGLGPFTGQAVHFKYSAPEPKEYSQLRYSYEAKRHWDVLEHEMEGKRYFMGENYTIVDMSIWPWARSLPFIFGETAAADYPNLTRFAADISARPAALRAKALDTAHPYKAEFDNEARVHMFPYMKPLLAT